MEEVYSNRHRTQKTLLKITYDARHEHRTPEHEQRALQNYTKNVTKIEDKACETENTYNARNEWRPSKRCNRPCGIPKLSTDDTHVSSPLLEFQFPYAHLRYGRCNDSTNHRCTPLTHDTLRNGFEDTMLYVLPPLI